jgi:hypothetical protein
VNTWWTSWPVYGVVGVVFAAALWKLLRKRAPLRCPCCGDSRVDWQGSGTRAADARYIEYRTYTCLGCSERLVGEVDGRLQRFDDWVPGQSPCPPAPAKLVS